MRKEYAWIVAFIMGALIGGGALYIIQNERAGRAPTDAELMAEYYRAEALTAVSPYEIKTALQRGTYGDYVLVDMRSPAEYEAGHITGAINIPNYLPEDASGEKSEERIAAAFARAAAEHPGKDIIAHCYSAACMVSRKVGNMLTKHGIAIKHLNIGWYEWKYYWTIWNGEDGTRAEDFITTGIAPGEPTIEEAIAPCGEGEFSC